METSIIIKLSLSLLLLLWNISLVLSGPAHIGSSLSSLGGTPKTYTCLYGFLIVSLVTLSASISIRWRLSITSAILVTSIIWRWSNSSPLTLPAVSCLKKIPSAERSSIPDVTTLKKEEAIILTFKVSSRPFIGQGTTSWIGSDLKMLMLCLRRSFYIDSTIITYLLRTWTRVK